MKLSLTGKALLAYLEEEKQHLEQKTRDIKDAMAEHQRRCKVRGCTLEHNAQGFLTSIPQYLLKKEKLRRAIVPEDNYRLTMKELMVGFVENPFDSITYLEMHLVQSVQETQSAN
jgi:hypothetical protein